MSMSVLVYVIVTKVITTVECAPKLGHILVDPLSLDATELESFTKTINKSSSAGIVQEQVMDTELHKREVMQPTNQTSKNQSKEQTMSSSTLNKDIKPNMALEVLESNSNKIAKNITPKKKIIRLPQADSLSDTSTSSEWLDPDLDNESWSPSSKWLSLETKSTEVDTNNEISKQKPEVGTRIRTLATRGNLDSIKDSQSENGPSKVIYPKREIIIPQKILMKVLRNTAEAQEDPINSKKPCMGYDYDVTICRYYGDRYLCGYNKNVGDLKDTEEIEDLGHGCRLRGDRKECGYEVGTENDSVKNSILKKQILSMTETATAQPSTGAIKTSDSAQSTHTANTHNITPSKETTTSTMPKQACVEKDDRLVCYDVPA